MAEASAIRSLVWPCQVQCDGAKPVSDETGFTLIEMLVSLALMALVAMLLLQSLQATAVITGSARRLSAQEQVQIVREHVRGTFTEALRRRGNGGRVPFIGQADRLVAVVAANGEAGRGTELRVGLGIVEQPRGAGLALVETRQTAASAAEEPEILLDGVLGLRLRYFGPYAQDALPGWQPDWTRTDRLPTLIEVAVDFAPTDPRRWPALVVPLGTGR